MAGEAGGKYGQNQEKISKQGIRGAAIWYFLIIIQFAALLISAGRLNWANSWIYLGLSIGYQTILVVVLAIYNPKVLNARDSFSKEGTKLFDRIYVVIYEPLVLAAFVVMGLDAGRYGWSSMPTWLVVFGIVISLPLFLVTVWAMAVNPYFETTVRIQDDRGHRVINSGPYKYVRHPGYAGFIVSLFYTPFILGSWWGFIPLSVLAVVIVIRTALEDKTLMEELPGYKDYARETRYRLFPYIW